MSRMSVLLPEPLAPRTPRISPRSSRIDTSCDRDDRRLLALHLEPLGGVLHEECRDGCRHGGGRSVGPRRVSRMAASRTGRPSCSVVVAGWRSRSLLLDAVVGIGIGPEMTKSRGPVRPCRDSGSRLLVSTRRASGHQKSRGPDLAHGSWCFVRAAYAADNSARDGHRPPVDGSPEGRRRARGEGAEVHHFGALLSRLRARTSGAGPESTSGRPRVSTWTNDDVGHRHPSISAVPDVGARRRSARRGARSGLTGRTLGPRSAPAKTLVASSEPSARDRPWAEMYMPTVTSDSFAGRDAVDPVGRGRVDVDRHGRVVPALDRDRRARHGGHLADPEVGHDVDDVRGER